MCRCFKRSLYREIFCEGIRYCQEKKGYKLQWSGQHRTDLFALLKAETCTFSINKKMLVNAIANSKHFYTATEKIKIGLLTRVSVTVIMLQLQA